MNVFIMTDIEGIPDIYTIGDIEFGSDKYPLAMMALTRWLNITADACYAEGADRVYFLDGHAGPSRCNIVYEKLDKRLTEVDTDGWIQLTKQGKIDCVIELGSHARAGTVGGFLDHTTNSRRIFCDRVGGREYSELALHALFLSAYGIPTALCIGDVTACQQAREYIPDLVLAPIKLATERNLCTPLDHPEKRIREGVRQALSCYSDISLLKPALPTDVSITYYRTDFLEETVTKCKCKYTRTDARTLSKTVENFYDYYELYFH